MPIVHALIYLVSWSAPILVLVFEVLRAVGFVSWVLLNLNVGILSDSVKAVEHVLAGQFETAMGVLRAAVRDAVVGIRVELTAIRIAILQTATHHGRIKTKGFEM